MPKDLRNSQREAFLKKNHIDNIKCAFHWRQPVESEFQADFQSDWQAQLGGNGDTSGVSRMVLHYMKIVPLKVDASSRKYFRIILKNGKTYVLADDELKKNKLPEFAALSKFFLNHGVHTPKVYFEDFNQGFLLLEDLGDDTFTRLLDKGVDEAFLYDLATDALIKIANINQRPENIADLTKRRLIDDICFFADWYVPMAKGEPLTEFERKEFVGLVEPLADLAFKVPMGIVLWDYHVDNIMLKKGENECDVIDFQDTMWGPVTYDIMSLLEDARRDVSLSVQSTMKEKFFAALNGVKRQDFDDSYAFLSLFRHMRVLGRFTILGFVNNKPQYLKFVPHLWDMLSKTLQYSKFEEIRKWLEAVLPQEKRVIPQRKPINEAMVLAAGRGVRMRELTDHLPKPLVKVGNKALIDYNFERLKNIGIKDVVVNLCYQGDLIKKHLEENERDFHITYSLEDEALETGGGIKKALDYFKNEAFFVCNSDVFFEEEKIKPAMWKMLDAWNDKKFDILLLLQDLNNVCGDKGVGDYRIKSGVLERNREKTDGFDYMFGGIYIIKKSVFEGIKKDKFSARDLFDEAEKKGKLGYVVNHSTFYHIGTPEAFNAAQEKIKKQ